MLTDQERAYLRFERCLRADFRSPTGAWSSWSSQRVRSVAWSEASMCSRPSSGRRSSCSAGHRRGAEGGGRRRLRDVSADRRGAVAWGRRRARARTLGGGVRRPARVLRSLRPGPFWWLLRTALTVQLLGSLGRHSGVVPAIRPRILRRTCGNAGLTGRNHLNRAVGHRGRQGKPTRREQRDAMWKTTRRAFARLRSCAPVQMRGGALGQVLAAGGRS